MAGLPQPPPWPAFAKLPSAGLNTKAVLTAALPVEVVLPPAISTFPFGSNVTVAPKRAAMVPVVVASTGATLTSAVEVAVEFAPVPSVTVSVYVVSCVIAVQLKVCGDVVEFGGEQVEPVVPEVAMTDAEAPVPPPNTALSCRPAFPAVNVSGPMKLVIVGRFTVTVADLGGAESPAWLVTDSVKTVVVWSAPVFAV